MKRCGKSAPPRQQWRGQGKPHTEQDQIGRNPAHSGRSVSMSGSLARMGGGVPARRAKPPGRSLEAHSDVHPRGMTVPPAKADRIRLTGPAATSDLLRGPSLRSEFRQRAPASLTPAWRLNLQVRLPSSFKSRSFAPFRISAAGFRFAHARLGPSTYSSGGCAASRES